MIAYTSQELVSSSDFAKKFGTYLAQLKTDVVDKIAILKNNNIEAVLVPKDDYEAMKRAWELQEHREIYEMVQKREAISKEEYVAFEDMAKRLNIDTNDL
jgi:PHD/YefM family antitoxin component YafN of YafNO toxin-antitoxin module